MTWVLASAPVWGSASMALAAGEARTIADGAPLSRP